MATLADLNRHIKRMRRKDKPHVYRTISGKYTLCSCWATGGQDHKFGRASDSYRRDRRRFNRRAHRQRMVNAHR